MNELPVVDSVGLPQYDSKTKTVCGYLKKKGNYTWSVRYVWIKIDIADDRNYVLACSSSNSRNLKAVRIFSLAQATLIKEKDHIFMIKLASGKSFLFACVDEAEMFRWTASLQYIIEVAGQRDEYFQELHLREDYTEDIDGNAHYGKDTSNQADKQAYDAEQQDNEDMPMSINCATDESHDVNSTVTLPSFDVEGLPSKQDTISLFSPAATTRRVNYQDEIRSYQTFAATTTENECAAVGDDFELSPRKTKQLKLVATERKRSFGTVAVTTELVWELLLFAIAAAMLISAFFVYLAKQSVKTTTNLVISPYLFIGEKALTLVFVFIGIKKNA